MYYVYDGRVFDDRDDLNDYRDDNPGGTTQRFNTKAEADASLGGMLTGNPSRDPTKTQPGETGPFDPNAGTTANIEDPGPIPEEDGRTPGPDLRTRLYNLFNTGFRWADIAEIWGAGEESLEEILDRIAGNIDVAPEDSTQARQILGQYVTESFDRAQEIVDTMVDNPEELADMEDPGELTKLFIEQGGMSFAGAAPPVTPAGSSGPLVITGGAGVTGEFERIQNTGGRIFGDNVPVVDEDGNPVLDADGNPVTEYREGLLDVMVPYIPGVSLPNWMPTAGVIFLPTIQEAVNKVGDIIDETGIGEAWEEGDIGEVLNDIGEIIVRSGEAAAGVLEEKVSEIIGTITGAITDPTRAGTVLGGVIGTAFPSIPQWLPPLILDPRVYGAVRNVLTQNFNTPEEDFPPITEEVEQDPTLMFTNRGNNVFVSREGDEFFVLSESEDLDFEFNGQYTREQLENTGLEIVDSGRYQELLDNLSFHALEEDIYQYSIEDLVARYEEEGGILPGDWKEMDEESRYNYFLDDYFDIPRTIEDPDKDDLPGDEEPPVEPPAEPEPEPEPPVEEPPTDQPEPEPEPPTDEPEPEPTPTDIESLFADFLAQIDEEFTGQIEQVNEIIQNFVETLPDFDAMPTMEDIAEYFEVNGVTLSEQNFDRIRQELADAGYLTQEQLTEALAGVATPEQVQQAIEGAGFATPEQVIQALAEAGYATPDDITNALANSGFVTEDRMLQALAEAGYATPEQVREIVDNAVSNIVIPEGATAEEVRQLIQEAIDGIPEGISLEDVGDVVNEAIANIEFPEGLSGDDVRSIVDSFGFATAENVQDIVNTAIANIQFPEGATTEEVRQLIQEALDGLPEGISLEDIGGIVNEAIANIEFPEGLSEGDVRGIVDSFGFATSADVQAGFDDLNDRFDDAINGIATQFSDQEAEFLASITGLEASLIQSLAAVEGGLSAELEMLGTDLISLQEDVAGRFDEFEAFTSEQFAFAADERQQLQQAIIAANGDITQLSADMQQMFADFGGTISDLFAGVGVDIEALQAGQITQQEALDQLRTSIGQQFSTAQEERQELQQAIIAVGGDVTQLSDDMMLRFQQQDQSIEELFAGTNVNIEALRQGQITQQEAFDAYQQYTTEQFGQAQQDRLALAQEIISVGGQVEALSADSQQRFAELGLSLADLQEEFNVNLVGLQQGQISQAEAFGQFRDSVTTRLGLAEEEREEILTRQADFERVYGEEQQALQQQIMGGNVLTALAAGGMFAAPTAPTRAPYKEFKEGITYRPREAPQLAIKTPALDYNEEAQKLLMRTRRRGMLV